MIYIINMRDKLASEYYLELRKEANGILKSMTARINTLKKRIRDIQNAKDSNVLSNAFTQTQISAKKAAPVLLAMIEGCRKMQNYYKTLLDDVGTMEKAKAQYHDELLRYQTAVMDKVGVAFFDKKTEAQVRYEIKNAQRALVKERKKVEKQKEELQIVQEELQEAIQETNLAKSSYYHLTENEIQLFEYDRPKILKGVEEYGSVALAVKKDKSIKSRVASILYHARKHKQFAQDLEIAKQVFKESLDAEVIDRALNGTVNPVFQKGEHLGDFAVKDNKLLLEVAKAKLPQEYNPRAYASANPSGPAGTTINLISFSGADETKMGYAHNIGVVQAVDESGKVKRITQSKTPLEIENKAFDEAKRKEDEEEMLSYYKDKDGAEEIIEGEVINAETSEE